VSVDLAVARFDGEGTAVQRYAAATQGAAGEAPWTQRIGFVERHHNGRLLLRGTFYGHYLDVDEGDHVSQRGAGEGAVTGALVGVLLGPAGIAAGFALGGMIGSQVAHPTEIESEPEAIAEQLRATVPRSSSAVVMMAAPQEVDEMLAAMSAGAQAVVRRSLTDEETAALDVSLGSAPRVAGDR